MLSALILANNFAVQMFVVTLLLPGPTNYWLQNYKWCHMSTRVCCCVLLSMVLFNHINHHIM